jgi:hypothetical protein
MTEAISKEIQRFPWAPIIILTALIGFIGPFWTSFIPASLQAHYNLGSAGCALNIQPLAFILILLAGFCMPLIGRGVRRGGRGKLSLTALTYLYVVGFTASRYVTNTWFYPWWPVIRFAADRYLSPVESVAYVPWFMAPKADVASQMIHGHVPVPWAEWIPSIFYAWSQAVLFAAFWIAIASIFRRQWIDVERVPFPQTMIAHELIERVRGEGGKRWGTPFAIGSILGLAFQIPIYLATLFPWFPDIYGWRAATCGTGAGQITADSPLASIIGLATWMKNPVYGAVFYLAPLSILFNAWFWYLIFLVLMQVAYIMGYYTGIPGMGGCGRVWCGGQGYWDSAPYKWVALSQVGGTIGLVLITLIMSRKYLLDTLRSALGRPSGEGPETNEPIRYRTAYALLAVSFVLLVVSFMALGLGLAAAILMPLTTFICFMMGVIVYSRVGYQISYNNRWGTFLFKALWPSQPEVPTSEWMLSFYFSTNYASNGTDYGWGAPVFSAMSGYRMANLTGVSNRNVFKAVAISSVVTPLTAIIGCLIVVHSFGLSGLQIGGGGGAFGCSSLTSCPTPANIAVSPTSDPWIPYAVAGALVVGLLSVLHARFVWFPFEPIGFLLATNGRSLLEGAWIMFLVAWVVKTATLRIGGSKAYENFGVPVAAGFIVSYMALIFVGGLVGIYKFFFPF